MGRQDVLCKKYSISKGKGMSDHEMKAATFGLSWSFPMKDGEEV